MAEYGCQYMGHHIVDHSASESAGDSMAPPARLNEGAPAVFTSGDRIAVPPNAVELLRASINARKNDSAVNDQIRTAAALICDEAHRMDAMPEQLLVSIKELCHSLPEYEAIPGARERDAFVSAVVTAAIEEYYRV
jgi:hypothetical protein